ncbi:MAG: protein kinase, partial [Verrucomicrobiales bacterium]|nr:protein kinase [Verrucomicrobiales bacterium]
MPTPTDGESRCPRCGQPIPGGQAGDVCARCLAEVFLKVDFDEEGDEAPLAAAGEKVGRYRIADVLGEGGFGVVYRAVEEGPLRREVALKLVKPGMDSRAVLARFDAEQRALGMLDHPNVARVLEAGVTEEGRPYFAMELIEGEPLNRFCASRELNLEQRLRVFLQVCSGVEHAHAKGLIHRDLKPSNVLVAPTANDGPRAVIIDFGIAKALWEELTPDTLYTSPRQMLGTPEYMSPEQASRGGLDVDTRADVYSLGALLYELVTGAPPLRAEDLRRASMLEWLRLIEEKDPVKPSKRMLETSGLTTSAMRRRAREELDWVVLKALSKERARRYQTVRELEEDVEHFLRHEPVRARPPSAAYAVRKWMRRHRALAVAGAVALMSLMAAVVVSAVMRSRAVEAETRTRQAFSVADERVAAEEVQDAFGHAVARLCRALRTDPENRSARYRLLVLLAGGSSGVLDAPMMAHEEPVSWAHMLPPDGGEVLTATSRDGTIHHWRTGGGQTQKLRNYTLPGRIKAQAVTADGARLLAVTAWEGGSVGRVWDLGSGEAVTQEFRLAEESDFVNQAAFFPDGRRFAAVTQGGSVGVWDARTGGVRWRAEFPVHGAALAVSVSPDAGLLAVGWQDKSMSLHDAADGRELWRREVLRRAVTGTAFSVDGRLALATHGEAFAQAVSAVEPLGELRHRYEHHFFMGDVALDPTGQRMSSGGVDGWLRLREMDAGFIEAVKMPASVTALAFTPDGARLLAGTEEPRAGFTLVSGVSGVRLRPAVPLGRAVDQIAMGPDGTRMVPVANTLEVGVFDIRDRRVPPQVLKTGPGCRYAGFLPSGGLVTLNMDGRFRRWDEGTLAETGEALTVGASERKDARVVSADGRVAAVWSEPGQVEVVDLENWRVMCRLPTVGRDAWLRLSTDGARLLVAERGAEEARLFDAGDGTLLESWRPDAGALSFADLTADGSTMVTGHADGAVVLKNPGTGELRRFEMEQAVLHVAVSPDGRRAVGSTLRADLALWDLEAEKEIVPEDGPPRHLDAGYAGIGIQSRFSADGRRFFTWFSEDKMVRIFLAETGAPEGEPLLHEDTVSTVVESPDGRLLLTKDDRERLYLWDLERRLLMNEVADFSNELARIAFSPTGDRVLVAGMAGTVQIWQHP